MQSYYSEFEKQTEKIKNEAAIGRLKPRLLMHACCCPCSSHCIELLADIFNITVYFYNPNIDEKEEYDKRYKEFLRFREEADFAGGISIVTEEYDPSPFYEISRGREMLPERGARCYDCYLLRMKKSAEYAAENGFDYYTTTLSISPYKNADWINEIGMRLENELRDRYEDRTPVFLFSDFKKKNGYKRSIELSKEYGLYRQDYCGCRYSKQARDEKLRKQAGNEKV